MDDIKQKRIEILAEITKLNKDRCDRCSGSTFPTRPCCDASVQVRELGKQLLTLVKERKASGGEHDWEEYLKWEAIAEQNGISRELFRKRVMANSEEYDRAATRPAGQKKKRMFTDEQIATAKKNGIKYQTLQNRVKRGMPVEEAIIRPEGYDRRFKHAK